MIGHRIARDAQEPRSGRRETLVIAIERSQSLHEDHGGYVFRDLPRRDTKAHIAIDRALVLHIPGPEIIGKRSLRISLALDGPFKGYFLLGRSLSTPMRQLVFDN